MRKGRVGESALISTTQSCACSVSRRRTAVPNDPEIGSFLKQQAEGVRQDGSELGLRSRGRIDAVSLRLPAPPGPRARHRRHPPGNRQQERRAAFSEPRRAARRVLVRRGARGLAHDPSAAVMRPSCRRSAARLNCNGTMRPRQRESKLLLESQITKCDRGMALAADEVLTGCRRRTIRARTGWTYSVARASGEGLSALAMTAPGSGPAAFGQFRPPWRPPLNG